MRGCESWAPHFPALPGSKMNKRLPFSKASLAVQVKSRRGSGEPAAGERPAHVSCTAHSRLCSLRAADVRR